MAATEERSLASSSGPFMSTLAADISPTTDILAMTSTAFTVAASPVTTEGGSPVECVTRPVGMAGGS